MNKVYTTLKEMTFINRKAVNNNRHETIPGGENNNPSVELSPKTN